MMLIMVDFFTIPEVARESLDCRMQWITVGAGLCNAVSWLVSELILQQ